MILAELAVTPLDERAEEKKHYVKIFDGGLGYLNIDISTGNMTAGSVRETEFLKTKFTNEAIEQLKQRDDVPLNWDEVTFEEAN
ncbi:Phage protein [Lactiplantibacillus plantarum]|nr:Phage protein [Lactiplantibacillus plantarum]